MKYCFKDAVFQLFRLFLICMLLVYVVIGFLIVLGGISFLYIKSIRKRDMEILALKEKVETADELKSNFFASILYEFKTPLTLIMNPVEDLLKSTRNEKDKNDFLLIKANSKKLARLIDQYLDLYRLESGKMEMNLKGGDLVRHVRVIASSFESLAVSKDISL